MGQLSWVNQLSSAVMGKLLCCPQLSWASRHQLSLASCYQQSRANCNHLSWASCHQLSLVSCNQLSSAVLGKLLPAVMGKLSWENQLSWASCHAVISRLRQAVIVIGKLSSAAISKLSSSLLWRKPKLHHHCTSLCTTEHHMKSVSCLQLDDS